MSELKDMPVVTVEQVQRFREEALRQLAEANKKLAEQQAKRDAFEQVAYIEHSDDAAVNAFCVAMKQKLRQKREQGRGGWDRKEECSNEFLSSLLIGHITKGDPVDIANFAMMIHQRGESVSPKALSTTSPTEALDKVVREAVDDEPEHCNCHPETCCHPWAR